ncbi:CheY-like chemotaxis protein [Methylopila capsulata]|uniref:CheY-like chemotaxis protein n=1 Tax=Methylopila capsulata TaxID=61654 RepID=A0A9W6MRP1_9HYPH|nr:response regulator [Methylopila capsulata]MBM7850088.1 CheY-like chemotaxis protein [Methylopila capsulata]GLK55379.1 response regulator [Methylopila capsulata]
MRVLYVDDEADIRDIVGMSLALDPDITVETASSGAEALTAVQAQLPDVILLDVMMPDMDGPTTLFRLRERKDSRDVPVIFMTARTQGHEIERFKTFGALGVIAKPFDPITLASDLKALLARASRG